MDIKSGADFSYFVLKNGKMLTKNLEISYQLLYKTHIYMRGEWDVHLSYLKTKRKMKIKLDF